MKTFIIILLLVAGSVVLLSVGVLLRHDHKFRSEHISQNRLMRERGIHCATSQDREERGRSATGRRVAPTGRPAAYSLEEQRLTTND